MTSAQQMLRQAEWPKAETLIGSTKPATKKRAGFLARLLSALHATRREQAAREINRYQHLVQKSLRDFRPNCM